MSSDEQSTNCLTIINVFNYQLIISFLFQALVMKVGMDSIMASYFALFEVINHSFGERFWFCFSIEDFTNTFLPQFTPGFRMLNLLRGQ